MDSPQHDDARKQRAPSPPPSQKLPSLRLPRNTKHVLLGDSNLRKVEKKRLDPSGKTFIKSIGGLTIQNTVEILNATYPCRYVESVTVHVGTNDVAKGSSDCNISSDTMMMIDKLKIVFPNARIFISGILPQKGKLLVNIVKLNERLLALCNSANVIFIWNKHDFLAKDKFPSHLFVRDKYHLSQTGLGVLLRGMSRARTAVFGSGGSSESTPTTALSPDHFPPLEASNPQGGRRSVLSAVSRHEEGQSADHPSRREHKRPSSQRPGRAPLSRDVSPAASRVPTPVTSQRIPEVTPPHCPQHHPYPPAQMTTGPRDSEGDRSAVTNAFSGHPPSPMRNFFPLGLQQPFGHFQWPFNNYFPSPFIMNPSPYPFHGSPLMGR